MNNHIINISASILEALSQLNTLTDGVMTLIVTDADNHVVGTLTDGDIRRAFLNGESVESPVSSAAHRKFSFITPDSPVDAIKEARLKGIKLLPVTDNEGKLLRLLDLTQVETLLPLRAILMAGGKGERLRPMTLTTPKPLLQIDGMPIIDYNVRNMARAGITDVTVTTRYLAEQLYDHFSKPVFGINVKCVTEVEPLGTIGAASLIERPDEGDTLVMNSDLLTTISLEEMFIFHKAESADVTIAAIPYSVSVPYAILATDERRVLSLEEKPTYSYYANGGIYIFSNRLLNSIKKGEHTDAPQLIERAIANGGKVVFFPVDGTWIDIGSPTDFRHAEELMRHHRAMGRF
jgi:dTDP-glucose pyrophosphorylase